MSIVNTNPVVNDDIRSKLNLQFSKYGIKEAMWSISDRKALELNGYTNKFNKKVWSIVGEDVVAAIQKFFKNDKHLQAWNNAAISLVLNLPTNSRDSRLIACFHTIYKYISKLIYSRLSNFLHLISQNQRGFCL